jgi:hypothetical protein
MSTNTLKRIAEMYCENPTNITSLFIEGKHYTKAEIIEIAKTYCKDKFCLEHVPVLKDITQKDSDEEVNRHRDLMKSFKNNIRDLKDIS